tara:strand:+ start:10307 stop:10834 length:528 start_codon:yes stop_codon:yes gene_type:complete
MISKEIDHFIRDIEDFPKKGIRFKDITSLLLNSNLCTKIVNYTSANLDRTKIDAIAGVESRGFLFGFLLANKLDVPFVPVRKSGKLPGETIKYSYELEYGRSEIEIHKNDISKNWNVLVHDDLLATGGTAAAAAQLIKNLNANVFGFSFIIELSELNGRKKLCKYSNNIITLKNY